MGTRPVPFSAKPLATCTPARSTRTASLYGRTVENSHDDWYGRLWDYAWHHFVDHRHGAWYRILTRDNRKIDNQKSPAGKTDYHTMGACHELPGLLRGKGQP